MYIPAPTLIAARLLPLLLLATEFQLPIGVDVFTKILPRVPPPPYDSDGCDVGLDVGCVDGLDDGEHVGCLDGCDDGCDDG